MGKGLSTPIPHHQLQVPVGLTETERQRSTLTGEKEHCTCIIPPVIPHM